MRPTRGFAGIEEGISTVFFALYKHILIERHQFPVIPVRTMRQIITVAKGIMMSRLITVVYRRSPNPWFVGPDVTMRAMQEGGAVLRMSDMLASYALIYNTGDTRKVTATVLSGLKSLVDFEELTPGLPKFDGTEQYYMLTADKRTLLETVQNVIPTTGEGLIQTY